MGHLCIVCPVVLSLLETWIGRRVRQRRRVKARIDLLLLEEL